MKQVWHWALHLLKWPFPGVLRGMDPSKHQHKELGKEMVCLISEPENKYSDIVEWNRGMHGVGVRKDFSWNTVALDRKKIMQNLVSKCKMLSLSSRALFRLFPLSYSRLAYCSSCGPYTEATSCRLRPPAPEAELCDPMNVCSSLRSPLQRNCLFTFPGAWLECKSLKETEKPHRVHRVYSGPIQRVAHRRAQ